jgi:predicted nucleic acid-binding Zn ribbon protein
MKNQCQNCGKKYTRAGNFCSDVCRNISLEKRVNEEVSNRSFCHYCGRKSPNGEKFCSDIHREDFEEARAEGRKISIRVNEKTIIQTDKYDKIPEMIAKYTFISRDVTRGTGGNNVTV